MVNKRGEGMGLFWIVFIVIIAIMIVVAVANGVLTGFNIPDELSFRDAFNAESVSFADAWNFEGFVVFDFIFGKMPQLLVDWLGGDQGGEISASIIVIGIWLMFLLIFGDIMNLFGMFNKGVAWTVAFVLTLIIANLKIVILLSVVALTITAVFGALSVIASIIFIFAMFLMFHFALGTAGFKFRQKLILRKAQEASLKAAAGGEDVAGTIRGLRRVGKAFKDI